MRRLAFAQVRAVFTRSVNGSEAWLGRRLAGWILLGLVAGIYTAAYLNDPLYPDSHPLESRTGWWTWSDQFYYWKSAAELAQFRLTPAHYYYPLGYPALGALFWRVMPTHAFFLPDLWLVLAASVAWWRLAQRWLSRVQALVTGAAFIVFHAGLLRLSNVVPWNTTATQFTLLAGMWVVIATNGPRAVARLTALAALTYLVRPGDAACFAPLLIWSVVRLPAWRERFLCAAGGMAAIGAVVLCMGLINHAVFGAWKTPYENISWVEIGFFSYPLSNKLFWIFVDGRPFFGESDTALLFRYPWLFLAIPGVIYAIRSAGMAAVSALAALALNWGLYISYNDFFPSAVYRYSLIHYLSWGFAPLFILSVAAVVRGWRERSTWAGLAMAAGCVVFALGVRLERRELPASVSPGQVNQLPAVRPLWVEFPGVPLEAAAALRLDGRPIRDAADYQIPYASADLPLLLSSRAQGTTLSFTAEAGVQAEPRVGIYEWKWRLGLDRLRQQAGD